MNFIESYQLLNQQLTEKNTIAGVRSVAFLLFNYCISSKYAFVLKDNEKLAKELQIHPRTLKIHLKTLIDLGIVEEIQKGINRYVKRELTLSIFKDYIAKEKVKATPKATTTATTIGLAEEPIEEVVTEKEKTGAKEDVPEFLKVPKVKLPPKRKPRKNKKAPFVAPTKKEFIEYGLIYCMNQVNDVLIMDAVNPLLQTKFDSWEAGEWHNGNGHKIHNWKQSIISTMPYLIKQAKANLEHQKQEEIKKMNYDAKNSNTGKRTYKTLPIQGLMLD